MSTNIPEELKKISGVKDKLEKLDLLNKRKNEIINNKDKIEKDYLDIIKIIDLFDKSDKVEIKSFENENKENFLRDYNNKINEIEIRQRELMSIKDIVNKKKEILNQFPDIINLEKDKMINKMNEVEKEIINCEKNKKRLKRIKNLYENVSLQKKIESFLDLYHESDKLMTEITIIELNYLGNKDEVIKNAERYIPKIEKIEKDLETHYGKMLSELSKIPKSGRKLKEVRESIEDIKNDLNKCKVLFENITTERKIIDKNDFMKFPTIHEKREKDRSELYNITSEEIKKYFESIIFLYSSIEYRYETSISYKKEVKFNIYTYKEDMEYLEKIDVKIKKLYKDSERFEHGQIVRKIFDQKIIPFYNETKQKLINKKIEYHKEKRKKIIENISDGIAIVTGIGMGYVGYLIGDKIGISILEVSSEGFRKIAHGLNLGMGIFSGMLIGFISTILTENLILKSQIIIEKKNGKKY